MEGSSSSDPSPSPSASRLLSNLPSRGLFSSSTVVSSNPGGMRVYVCEHETTPPEDQVIRTNQQNILIRSLMIKKQRGDSSSSKSGKGAAIVEGSRKRASERLSDAASAKRPNTQASSHQEGSHSHLSDKDLHTLTVERLRALLKEKGLSAKGKKDELIARLKG